MKQSADGSHVLNKVFKKKKILIAVVIYTVIIIYFAHYILNLGFFDIYCKIFNKCNQIYLSFHVILPFIFHLPQTALKMQEIQ